MIARSNRGLARARGARTTERDHRCCWANLGRGSYGGSMAALGLPAGLSGSAWGGVEPSARAGRPLTVCGLLLVAVLVAGCSATHERPPEPAGPSVVAEPARPG